MACLVTWLATCGIGFKLHGSGLQVVGSSYVQDVPFPHFMHLWSENWALRGEDGGLKAYASTTMSLGSYVHAFVHNNSTNATAITDIRFAGVSLNTAIAFSDQKTARHYPASIHFSKLGKVDLDRLFASGEPIWWKADPFNIPPEGYAEVVIRLRRTLTNAMTSLEVVTDRGNCAVQIVPETVPRFESISFSSGLDQIYAYVRSPHHPQRLPEQISVNGVDVTPETEILCDTNVDLVPLVVSLKRSLTNGAPVILKAGFADGPPALATARPAHEEFIYGMWGYINKGSTSQERVDYFLGDLGRHNINAVMQSYGGEVGDYLEGERGLEHSRLTGIRAMRRGPGRDLNPVYYFLMDEPDAHDFAVNQLPPTQRLGALGQDVVRTTSEFRAADAATLQLLNVDNTYKPENWYTYAQLPDVFCADPYFQEQQRIAWNDRPAWAASFVKPLYVLGVASVCRWASAPKPLHIILNAVRHEKTPGGFRYATPEEKTVELFYALGAGAKGFSYWWYTPYGEFRGCGATDPEAVKLWRQIGLLGAQVRTAGPILTRSCPAKVPLKAPARLWTRTLMSGPDTMVLLAVNDNIASDRLGTVVVTLLKTVVTIRSPTWLKAEDAFEIVPGGVRDVNWRVAGAEIILDLGNTLLARMVVITRDKFLRGRLEELHRKSFAQNVAALDATSGSETIDQSLR